MNQTTEKEKRTTNTSLAQWGLTFYNKKLAIIVHSCWLNFSFQNPATAPSLGTLSTNV